MLNIQIICIGKIKEDYLRSAVNEYSKRLSRFCKLEILELPDEKIPDKLNTSVANEIKQNECSNIIKYLKKSSYNIALDLSGKQLTSEQFSEKIENLSMTNSNITFIIGGSLGLTNELLSYCQEKLCFSKMTFPHQLIRVFLLEQIFRGFKIAHNETYHR